MKMRKGLLIGILTVLGSASSFAHDFAITTNGQSLYFNITNASRSTVEVTYQGSIADNPICSLEGEIAIPENVTYKNKVYQVVSIGRKAFQGANHLTGIVMPSTLKEIKDFAFENCRNLQKIVFPGKSVTFGQGIFFKCTSISNITFGSDWKRINFKAFRWSNSLQQVTIPAKVEKVYNLKDLKFLKRVNVDVNNVRFLSYNGALYNKFGNVLYGVPRDYEGTFKLKPGTQTVLKGALIDCSKIEQLVLTESLIDFSFRETSRMHQLTEIVFKSSKPINTAYANGNGVFLLQVASPDVKIIVPKKSKSQYQKSLVLEAGEYAEDTENSSLLYKVNLSELPQKKNIEGVKNFSDYE